MSWREGRVQVGDTQLSQATELGYDGSCYGSFNHMRHDAGRIPSDVRIDDMSSHSNPSGKFEAFYEKGNFFRVIHADGAYGGITPHGNLHFAFYSERSAIPKQVEFDVVDGLPGPERVIDTKKGLFREIETDVVMSFGTAVQFKFWLEHQLDLLRRQSGVSDSDWQAMQQAKV